MTENFRALIMKKIYETESMEEQTMNTKIQIIRSGRKTIALQIDKNLQITVRAPYRMTDREIFRFVEKHDLWIQKHMRKLEEKKSWEESHPVKKLSEEEIWELARQATVYIPERVAYYGEKMQIGYGRITIRNQKTRWGSCSEKGNLNFNCLLMLAPKDVIDYVVVHELCHRIEMNHSRKFWQEVQKVMPGYEKQKRWLKEHGEELINRMEEGKGISKKGDCK